MTTALNYASTTKRLPVWTFADKIKKARAMVGVGQNQFALAVGITSSTLAAYETGRSAPRFKDAAPLAKRIETYTGIPFDWFLIDDDPNETAEGTTKTPAATNGDGGQVGPAGLDPATSTVESGRFGQSEAVEQDQPAEIIAFPARNAS